MGNGQEMKEEEEEVALHPTLLQERTAFLDSKKEDPVAGDLMNLKVAACHQLKKGAKTGEPCMHTNHLTSDAGPTQGPSALQELL